jgi:hypothetical protein
VSGYAQHANNDYALSHRHSSLSGDELDVRKNSGKSLGVLLQLGDDISRIQCSTRISVQLEFMCN